MLCPDFFLGHPGGETKKGTISFEMEHMVTLCIPKNYLAPAQKVGLLSLMLLPVASKFSID